MLFGAGEWTILANRELNCWNMRPKVNTTGQYPHTALDAGSGNGRYAIPLAEAGFWVTAADRSTAACELIKKRAEEANIPAGRIKIVQTDFAQPDNELADMAYDLVFSSGLLEEVDPQQQPQTVFNMQRAVSPQGTLILRFCLEVSDRGITVADNYVINFFNDAGWEIVQHAKDHKMRPSIATIEFEDRVRTETIIARKV